MAVVRLRTSLPVVLDSTGKSKIAYLLRRTSADTTQLVSVPRAGFNCILRHTEPPAIRLSSIGVTPELAALPDTIVGPAAPEKREGIIVAPDDEEAAAEPVSFCDPVAVTGGGAHSRPSESAPCSSPAHVELQVQLLA